MVEYQLIFTRVTDDSSLTESGWCLRLCLVSRVSSMCHRSVTISLFSACSQDFAVASADDRHPNPERRQTSKDQTPGTRKRVSAKR